MPMIRKTLLVASAVLTVLPAGAWAQARSRYIWHNPRIRDLRTLGGLFGTDSSGLGRMRRYSGPAGSNVLSSSVSAFQLRRLSSPGPSGSSAGSGLRPLRGQHYGTIELNLRGLAGSDLQGAAPDWSKTLTGYFQTAGYASELAARKDKPVSSFVPTEPSTYQKYMLAGDRAFRAGKYGEARDQFELALVYARELPEARLSMVHAEFALGGYHLAAEHLRMTLRYFPELALVNMRIRDFYGPEKVKDFDRHHEALLHELERSAANQDGWLLAAYVEYFDGKAEQAASALQQAFLKAQNDKDERTVKAAKIFWDSMAVAGKVTGSVDPTAPAPSPASQPSSKTTTVPAAATHEAADKSPLK